MPKKPESFKEIIEQHTHVRITQVPKRMLPAILSAAEESKDVGLFATQDYKVGQRFNSGTWNRGQTTESRPTPIKLEKDHVAAAIYSDASATDFYRGATDVLAGRIATGRPIVRPIEAQAHTAHESPVHMQTLPLAATQVAMAQTVELGHHAGGGGGTGWDRRG